MLHLEWLALYTACTVPEFIEPVFTKTSRKRSFLVIENERFGLVFTKTGSINSGTGHFPPALAYNLFSPPANGKHGPIPEEMSQTLLTNKPKLSTRQ